MENKTKRFYKEKEMVWIIAEKKEGKVKSINRETLEVIVTIKEGKDIVEKTLKMWEIDKLKFAPLEKLKEKQNRGKVTYFSSVNGGIIPTKEEENGGRDCYARLEPKTIDGKEVFEMFLPRFTLSKIPLGFASYLNKEDILSIKHERSSIGSVGLINVSGLIDSTYQGEVILQVIPIQADVLLTSEVEKIEFDEINNLFLVPTSKAIAQAVVLRQSDAKDVHIPYNDLLKKPSTRGTGGWGSSGK